MCVVDCFDLDVFAVDGVVSRTESQLFTCDVVTWIGMVPPDTAYLADKGLGFKVPPFELYGLNTVCSLEPILFIYAERCKRSNLTKT